MTRRFTSALVLTIAALSGPQAFAQAQVKAAPKAAQATRKDAPAGTNSPAPGTNPAKTGDVILKAMHDELERSRQLALADLNAPYYIEYSVDDASSFSTTSSMGGLIGTTQNRFRIPQIRVRVGDYQFDNTNYLYSDYYAGTRYDPEQLPLDDNYDVLRRNLWLGTDRVYKTAIEAIARKRAALKNVNQTQDLQDFWKAEPVQKLLPITNVTLDQAKWTARIRDLSAIFNRYPEVLSSQVNFEALQSTHYLYNSEGTTVRAPDTLFHVQVKATGQAPDGMVVRDAIVLQSLELSKLPGDTEMQTAVKQVAENVKALAAAPFGDTYSGPVIFEGVAAAQLFAEVLAPNLTLPRKPVGEPGRPVQFMASEFEGKIGSRVLPETFTVIDDATRTTHNKIPLFGSYPVDDEGVVPKPVTLIEKGKLKGYLLTRLPVKGFDASNGHARLPGPGGARIATISNLIVESSETVKAAELKQKLIEMIKQRNKPFGLIIRKLDYPSSASFEEIRRIAASAAQGGGGRPTSIPLLVYRVYPDGKEELVRGLRFRGLTARSLKDISAVSEETSVFHVMYNQAPFSVMGAGGYVAPQSVVAPSVLFEDLDLEKPQEDMPKLPVVPPPALTAAR